MGKYIVIADGEIYGEAVCDNFNDAKELMKEAIEDGENEPEKVKVFALGQEYKVVTEGYLLKKVE